jgi:hypothetical protein
MQSRLSLLRFFIVINELFGFMCINVAAVQFCTEFFGVCEQFEYANEIGNKRLTSVIEVCKSMDG